ncbi:hypothetical protein HMSSN139_43740 [Paenibacillus sp. HMSSN-139]|nr:hypothetical protein HMSSN139_43740 [Paenibacillus sp. HMSSN-139]
MKKPKRWFTLRNQIFISFMLLMVFVLGIASVLTYSRVSALLETNAEKHISQTALQANGRLDALIAQINTLTTQVATDDYVQKLLLAEVQGQETPFSSRQSLLPLFSDYQAYVTGIKSLELYTNDYRRLFPLNETQLIDTIDSQWINAANWAKGARMDRHRPARPVFRAGVATGQPARPLVFVRRISDGPDRPVLFSNS